MMSQLEKQPTEVKLPVPWGHIAAKVYGPSTETKILVVHGILDNAGSFDRLIELLPQQYQYVSIDLPGHGFSSPFPSGVPLKFFDYVYSLLLVLDALKWKTCIYLAHSFGSQIGIYFSILFPGRIEKFIAIDGFMPLPIDDIVSYTRSVYDLNSYGKTLETLYTRDEIIYALRCKRQEALNSSAAEAIFKRAVTEINGLYKYNRDPRLRNLVRPLFTKQQHKEFLMKFTTPVLIILAGNSQNVQQKFEIINEVVASGKLQFTIVIVKGNHDVHNNYPERVAPHVCKFLNNNLHSKL